MITRKEYNIPAPIVCPSCNRTVPFLFGEQRVCRSCLETIVGGPDTLNEVERVLLQKEDQIADLMTIIQLTKEMNERAKARLTAQSHVGMV